MSQMLFDTVSLNLAILRSTKYIFMLMVGIMEILPKKIQRAPPGEKVNVCDVLCVNYSVINTLVYFLYLVFRV